jgi:hypothetical protein
MNTNLGHTVQPPLPHVIRADSECACLSCLSATLARATICRTHAVASPRAPSAACFVHSTCRLPRFGIYLPAHCSFHSTPATRTWCHVLRYHKVSQPPALCTSTTPTRPFPQLFPKPHTPLGPSSYATSSKRLFMSPPQRAPRSPGCMMAETFSRVPPSTFVKEQGLLTHGVSLPRGWALIHLVTVIPTDTQ